MKYAIMEQVRTGYYSTMFVRKGRRLKTFDAALHRLRNEPSGTVIYGPGNKTLAIKQGSTVITSDNMLARECVA